MYLQEIAKNTLELSKFMCKPIEEIWEEHTSEEIKQTFSFEEIQAEIKKLQNGF